MWSGGGGPGGGGGFNLAGLANTRANQLLSKGSLENEMYRLQLQQAKWEAAEAKRAAAAARAPKFGARPADPNRNLRQAAEREQLLASMEQSKAMYQPPPTRMVFGPGVIPGPTLDVMRMSGAQRQMYLPQNSSEIGAVPSYSAASGMSRGNAAGAAAAETDEAVRLSGMMGAGLLPGASGFNWYGPQSAMGRANRNASIEDAYRLWLLKQQQGG
jgi:hypothetical protein